MILGKQLRLDSLFVLTRLIRHESLKIWELWLDLKELLLLQYCCLLRCYAVVKLDQGCVFVTISSLKLHHWELFKLISWWQLEVRHSLGLFIKESIKPWIWFSIIRKRVSCWILLFRFNIRLLFLCCRNWIKTLLIRKYRIFNWAFKIHVCVLHLRLGLFVRIGKYWRRLISWEILPRFMILMMRLKNWNEVSFSRSDL